MNETNVSTTDALTVENRDLQTFEQALEERIQSLRDQANTLEANLHRQPAQIKRLTRVQAEKVGLYF